MTARDESATLAPAATEVASRRVVAVVLTWRGRVGLFKRSAAVGHDSGLWHCISGYLDAGHDPRAQAVLEVHEETGLGVCDLGELRAGPRLCLEDGRGGAPWAVHTFLATTTQRRLELNWEHERYRWVSPASLPRFDGQVAWLPRVVQAVGLLPTARGTRTPQSGPTGREQPRLEAGGRPIIL